MLIQKHFRLPEETVEQLEKRDSVKYPTEASYVNAAILHFTEQEKIEKKLENIQQELKELHALCKKEFAIDDSYGENFSY
ncbi:hypothetical protein B5E53_08620 [Eubacterium sp. An11]|uniref:hypothetical protein n=1 Tax=Eubacterium sp. An11 TaxID=1965542 RepID=UPI0007A7D05D|nr:hypothetical protein [Eubacterium sp. An11]OUQ67257.1 hypothetical protein B5E53_08620 [Eubacterium sp. An11]CVI71517.1 hypothetical protein BN3660_02264 [Eubacteriaceae bacterium CHKCI004]